MKKRTRHPFPFVRRTFILLLAFATLYPLLARQEQRQKQQPLVEEVDVHWWVVPVFAVSKSGSTAPELNKSALRLEVDGKSIDGNIIPLPDAGQKEVQVKVFLG